MTHNIIMHKMSCFSRNTHLYRFNFVSSIQYTVNDGLNKCENDL